MGADGAANAGLGWRGSLRLALVIAATFPVMYIGMTAWPTAAVPADGPWPEWTTPAMIVLAALISVMLAGVVLWAEAGDRKQIQDNSDMLKKIAARQRKIMRNLRAKRGRRRSQRGGRRRRSCAS